MRKCIVLTVLFIFLKINIYSQTWYKRIQNKEFFSISLFTEPSAFFKNSGKKTAIEFERVFSDFYARIELGYIEHSDGSYLDMSFALGLHFSFFEKKELFYIGLRSGPIYRKDIFFGTFGGEAGINLRMRNKIVIGVRTTMDYRTDYKIYNLPMKLVNSNYIKIGFFI